MKVKIITQAYLLYETHAAIRQAYNFGEDLLIDVGTLFVYHYIMADHSYLKKVQLI